MRFGAFVANVQMFDPQVFGLQKGEARQLDPQQRLLLEATLGATAGQQALMQAAGGCGRAGANVAVAIGIQHMEYNTLGGVMQDATCFENALFQRLYHNHNMINCF